MADFTGIETKLQETEMKFTALGQKIDHEMEGTSATDNRIPVEKLLTNLQEVKKEYTEVTEQLRQLREEQKTAMENILQEFQAVGTTAEQLQKQQQ